MTEEPVYDVVVVGAGPVGENVAARAVRGGLTAVLVEAELLGGECSFWACIPSKALLRPGQARESALRVDGAEQAVTGPLDAAGAFARRDSFTHDWHDDSQVDWAEGAGISVLRGRARLAGVRRVEVALADGGTQVLVARHAVAVCTGSVPSEPPIDGLADVPHWGSREATSAKEVVGRLIVLGGGVVGVEMAQAHRRLGSDVVLLAASGLLGRAEPFAGELVADGLRADGVDVRLGIEVRSVRRDGEGVVVELADGSVAGDVLLVATGRRPATQDLGVEQFGLEPGGKLEIDDSGRVLAVSDGWLYAAGDVTGRAPLTHQGKYEARAVGDAIAARAKGELDGEPAAWSHCAATADHTAVPQVVFTDPEVAWVGRTEREAREAGLSIRVVDYDMGDVGGAALLADGYPGKARIVVDTDREVLVGVTFVGQDVAEMVHAGTVAVVGEVPLHRLWHAVPSFPSMSEVWLKLLEEYGL